MINGNLKFFNYGRSFVLTANNPENTPRFLVESKCTINFRDYYLCAPCQGENTYAEENLFANPPFEFTPIISQDKTLVFRRFNFYNPREKGEYKKIYKNEDTWGDKIFSIKEIEAKELLDTHKKIFDAVKGRSSIMCRIVIENNGKTAIIDFPIKTININNEKWQVDTGMLPYPDLAGKYQSQILSFSLASVAFNNFKSAEFLLRDFQAIDKYSIISPCIPIKKKDLKIYLYSL